ncbi:Cys-tRNA(Pro) deacylase [Tissierella pigra]|uniref:Cys-tRNA(Pro)/Cys-tRNA(Cys) deacylase n=1 Tax=Tissierella pigra TaxID=2607614 RepID=A0A6N7XJ03_9FIRM|nr:Cys-tRNA(Pro) deacylase [Tissierella pigra]MSU01586.1 Cys-tRNA(Pro) deacylase [Tissierella pigra]
MSNIKTNAMRILDQMKIDYNTITYDKSDDRIDGISVSEKIGREPKFVYKTLVTQGHSKNIYVFLLPVHKELDFKKAAKLAGEKNIDMIPVKDVFKFTGYIRGGCSPIGMKKSYKTFIDESALEIDNIIVSAGKIGVQVELQVVKLVQLVQGEIGNFIVDH